MMMPVMDGATTIRTLTKINPQVQVIAMSGLAANRHHAAIAGTDQVKAFLTKPYTTETLLQTLAQVMQQESTPS
jgi:CheY-like chemotaxis protein